MQKKETAAAICFLLALGLFVQAFTFAATPKRLEGGATWGSFLQEEKNSVDIMFLGSSLAYCDVIPSVIYEETGYSSYVMAGPEQPVPTTYYYIKEIYKTQSPSLVFVEITSAFFDKYSKFSKINVGYMPKSFNRISAMFNCVPKEDWFSVVFPLYDYHDLWTGIRLKSFKGYESDALAGYTFLSNFIEAKEPKVRPIEHNEALYSEYIEYLKKIAEICGEKGSKLVFYITPSYYRPEEPYISMLKADIESLGNASFVNFNDTYDEIGIDPMTDYYDLLHFNYRGAEKFSAYLAPFIKSFNISPKEANREVWESRVLHYRSLSGGT